MHACIGTITYARNKNYVYGMVPQHGMLIALIFTCYILQGTAMHACKGVYIRMLA